MAYAEKGDLSLSAQRLIELTDNDDEPGVVDEDLLAQLEVESERIVNAVLAPTNRTPFLDDAVPPLIASITAWIWAYRIYRHREVMEIPAPIVDDHDLAMEMLGQIANGTISIDPPDDALAAVPSVHSSRPRGWTQRGRWH